MHCRLAIFTRHDCYNWFPFTGSSGCARLQPSFGSVPHGQQFHKLVSPVANVSELDLGSLPSAPGLRGLFVMGLVQWSPLKNVPVWPRHILTIILVIIVAFLLDRLLILPISPKVRRETKNRFESFRTRHAAGKRGATLKANRAHPFVRSLIGRDK
jgi:hypothetical protein